MSVVEPPGPCDDRQLLILRRACEFQLCALFLALPFEYYFRSREQTLFTSLKLQIVLFVVTWMCLKSAEALRLGRAIWSRLIQPLSIILLLAIALFVLVQALAAASASEFSGNAAKAAVKTALGALLAIAAADLAAGFRPRTSGRDDPVRRSMLALSMSGALTALLGLGGLAGIGAFEEIVRLFQRSEYFLGSRIRFVSTMEYPNTAGTLLSAALCASLALAVFLRPGRNRLWRPLWLALAAVQGLALGLTFSRGAMASTMLAVLAATVVLRRPAGRQERRTAMVACFMVMLGGMAGLYFASRSADREITATGKRMARWGLKAEDEGTYLLPDHAYPQTIVVENSSPFHWRGGDCGVGYRWYCLSADQSLPLVAGSAFAAAVAPKQEVRVQVSLVTPSMEGEYLLIWFVTCRDGDMRELKDSYSPASLYIVGRAGPVSEMRPSGKAGRYLDAIRSERRNPEVTIAPSRPDLWLAAFRMFSERPFLGMGPDNFRLLKWRYMDIPLKDERILANNLYLEMLSGSGILGLASFSWLLWEFGCALAAKVSLARSPSDWSAAYFGVAYLSAFALHGIVDYFLKFTPTFLLFWLLLGVLCASGRGDRETYAHRL